MQVFDIGNMSAHPHADRDKNVLHSSGRFKVRIIELPADGRIPPCEMAANVIFYVITGEAEVTVNQEKKTVSAGQCLISEPATVSMKSDDGVKIMGIQIEI